jgi:hypothetical protein
MRCAERHLLRPDTVPNQRDRNADGNDSDRDSRDKSSVQHTHHPHFRFHSSNIPKLLVRGGLRLLAIHALLNIPSDALVHVETQLVVKLLFESTRAEDIQKSSQQ